MIASLTTGWLWWTHASAVIADRLAPSFAFTVLDSDWSHCHPSPAARVTRGLPIILIHLYARRPCFDSNTPLFTLVLWPNQQENHSAFAADSGRSTPASVSIGAFNGIFASVKFPWSKLVLGAKPRSQFQLKLKTPGHLNLRNNEQPPLQLFCWIFTVPFPICRIQWRPQTPDTSADRQHEKWPLAVLDRKVYTNGKSADVRNNRGLYRLNRKAGSQKPSIN